MTIETLLTHYGLAALALGAGLEGETAVIAGGLLAHRGLFAPWEAALASFAGSFAADQAFFLLGRRYRDHRWVKKVQAKAAFARALAAFERHPTAFILGFRFIYGIRTVSPIAIGTSKVSARRFLILNAIAAAIWAPIFTAIGYGGGQLLHRWFPHGKPPLSVIAAVILGILAAGLACHLVIRWRQRDA